MSPIEIFTSFHNRHYCSKSSSTPSNAFGHGYTKHNPYGHGKLHGSIAIMRNNILKSKGLSPNNTDDIASLQVQDYKNYFKSLVGNTSVEAQTSLHGENMDSYTSTESCVPCKIKEVIPDVSQQQMFCQICKFEGRGRLLQNVAFCKNHGVNACIHSHILIIWLTIYFLISSLDTKKYHDWSWVCPHGNISCWDKFHTFYLHQNLFISPNNDPEKKTGISMEKTRRGSIISKK